MRTKTILPLAACIVICVVALIYWPVHQAGFVWVDKIIFHDNAWLRYGDGWKQIIFHNFYDWNDYFRPLVVALFVFEDRAFDVAAGPMHLVSLSIHLTNTLLVGLLALTLFPSERIAKPSIMIIAATMLLYGLHPALIEPVVWISCQAELVVTFFILLALLLNTLINHPVLRAFAVAICFFLGACAKESAASLPLLLVLIDWMRTQTPHNKDENIARLRSLFRRQWLVYVSVIAAGIAYLTLRHWGLGFLLQPKAVQTAPAFARLQTICFTYLTYWRILIWPMIGLGPMHVVNEARFGALGTASLATNAAALSILLVGLRLAWKRQPMGILIIAVTAALLPVLHIIPIAFDESLYHERYAMTAIAMASILMPLVISTISLPIAHLRALTVAVGTVALLWLGMAIVNIHVTLPLWADETKLWLWVLRENPGSVVAQNHLLTTFMDLDDRPHARQIADMLLAEKPNCPMCMVNVANLALTDGDLPRAETALETAKKTIRNAAQPRLIQAFILSTGLLLEMKGDVPAAAEAYHDAIAMEPLDPLARINLALLLARQGRVREARETVDAALPLFAPDERELRRQIFERVLTISNATSTNKN